MQTMLASAAQTASGVGSTITVPPDTAGAKFLLDVTAAGTLVGDLLDVWNQSSFDATNWDDFVRFTQVLGNGGAKQYVARWARDAAPTTPQGALQDKAIAAGVQQGPVALSWRVAYVITNGGGTHSFTFSVSAQLFRRG